MSKIQNLLANVKKSLADLVTTENTEAVAKVTKDLDALAQEGESLETKATELSNQIVDMVKGTLVSKEEPKDENNIEQPKDLGDVAQEELNKILKGDK